MASLSWLPLPKARWPRALGGVNPPNQGIAEVMGAHARPQVPAREWAAWGPPGVASLPTASLLHSPGLSPWGSPPGTWSLLASSG